MRFFFKGSDPRQLYPDLQILRFFILSAFLAQCSYLQWLGDVDPLEVNGLHVVEGEGQVLVHLAALRLAHTPIFVSWYTSLTLLPIVARIYLFQKSYLFSIILYTFFMIDRIRPMKKVSVTHNSETRDPNTNFLPDPDPTKQHGSQSSTLRMSMLYIYS